MAEPWYQAPETRRENSMDLRRRIQVVGVLVLMVLTFVLVVYTLLTTP